MDVDDAERRQVNDDLRDDLTVADDHHDVGLEGAEVLDDLRATDPLGLINGEVER